MDEKYVRPSKEEIRAEAERRGILRYIHENAEDVAIKLHKRVMDLELKVWDGKETSPESPLIEQEETQLTAACDQREAEQKAKDEAAARPAPSAKKKTVF